MIRFRRGSLPALLLAAVCLTSPQPVHGQQAPLIPLEHFFDNPEITGARLSPDGQWLSYLKPYRSKLNLYVRPIRGGAERLMTMDTIRPVSSYFWAADGSRLLYAQDKGGNENFHVYSVALAGDGTPTARDLTPFEGVRALIFDVPREAPERILIGLNRRDPSAFDAYWLNLESGELTLVAQNPGRHLGYMLDKQLKVRVALGQNARGGTEVYARDDERADWRTVASYPPEENVGPLRFHPDGQRVYMSSNHGDTDLARLVLLDLRTGAETPLEGDPQNEVDLGQAWFSDITDKLQATIYLADTVRVYPKTPAVAQALADLRKLHAGTPNLVSSTRDEKQWIVSYDDPRDPGATFLYDMDTRKGEFLFRPRPWLKPDQLADMQPVRFRAADGLTIHGYLTTPRGVRARNLPLVLNVHGGPWARDTWGYDAEAQLLANRGYAVLQINYRGSTGYGKKFYNAAVKEWAGKMHSDLIDGVQWAIAQGIADAKKVAIYGGSYGGYATLVGLTFTPETFVCGVDYVGPSSLITLIESFPAYWRPFLEGTFYRHVGDPAKEADREDMKRRSPLFLVDRIDDPLLIAQGANDPRVTKREADQMAIALRDRGVQVRYIIAENEGHGFLNADNRLALYRAMEQFLGQCLGGRVQPTIAPAVQQQIAKMTVNVDTLKLAAAQPVAHRELRVGDAAVDGTRVRAGADTLRLVLVQGGQERELGTLVEETRVAQEGGQAVVQEIQTLQSPMLGSSTDTLVVVHKTLAPLRHRSKNMQRTLSLDFHGDHVAGTSTPAGGTAQTIDAKLAAAVFDASAVDLVIRSLPLAENYAVKLPAYLHEAGGLIWVTASVAASESVDGKDAWKVESDIGGQKFTFWVDKVSRDVLRQVLAPAPGVEVRFLKE